MANKEETVDTASAEATPKSTENATAETKPVETSESPETATPVQEATVKDLSEEQLAYAKKLPKDSGVPAIYVVGNLFFQDKKYADGRSASSGKPVITVEN